MSTISFNNHDVTLILKHKPLLRAFLSSIFQSEKKEFKSISYIFCTDKFLLTLNQQYLKHNTLTDIITFTLSDPFLPIVSEIYISTERVIENAASLEVAFENELYRVMIHGILHLCGYSDHTKELKIQIHAKEDYYLSKMNFSKSYK